jgi:hypothetical protein
VASAGDTCAVELEASGTAAGSAGLLVLPWAVALLEGGVAAELLPEVFAAMAKRS